MKYGRDAKRSLLLQNDGERLHDNKKADTDEIKLCEPRRRSSGRKTRVWPGLSFLRAWNFYSFTSAEASLIA